MITSSRGRVRIGVLVPFTNSNLEADMALLRPDGVSVHFARLGGYDADEIPDSGQMAGLGQSSLDEPLRLLAGVRPDLVMYGCTSATLSLGVEFDRDLARRIERDMKAATVTAAGSLVHALEALGSRRIAFASPYVRELNDRAISFLADSGFEIVSRSDVDADLGNYGQGALTPEDVKALARRADHPEAQAIVLSCTDMRAVEAVDDLEAELGKPVVTSNQAMMFQAVKLLGLTDTGIQCGRLFALYGAGP